MGFTERGQYVVHGVTTVTLKRFVMANQDGVLRTDIGSMVQTATTMDGRFAIRANVLRITLSARVPTRTQLRPLLIHFAMNTKLSSPKCNSLCKLTKSLLIVESDVFNNPKQI